MSTGERAEIEEAVGKELAKVGVEGAIVLAGNGIELHPAGGGAPVSIDVELIVKQWPLLPPDLRSRKANEMARRLVGAQQAGRAASGQRDGDLDTGARSRITSAVAGVFGLLVLIGAGRFLLPRLTGPDKVETKTPAEATGVRQDRLARACEAVRSNIDEGKAFGPFALEGFVVELWLASNKTRALRESPALTALVAGGKLHPEDDEQLAHVIDGTLELADGFDAEAAARSPAWTAVTVRFRDGYARAFFAEESRPRFLGLAERVAAAAGADHAALYARCAHLPTHDVGAWFHGPDLAGAAATMVYEMGMGPFADPKIIDRGALRGPGDLDALRKAAGDVSDAIPRIVGTAGGSVGTSSGATLQFSLAAPARATKAARGLARKMGVGLGTAED